MPEITLTRYECWLLGKDHQIAGYSYRREAAGHRRIADRKGPHWQDSLKKALQCDRKARRREARARLLLGLFWKGKFKKGKKGKP